MQIMFNRRGQQPMGIYWGALWSWPLNDPDRSGRRLALTIQCSVYGE